MATNTTIVPLVLSGGSGTRLWPVSRPDAPKQLLPMVDDRTMLLATLERVRDLPARNPAVVVCNTAHLDAVARDLAAAGETETTTILEPVGRNTAPAVAAAAQFVANDPILLVMPADHVIRDQDAFVHAVTIGAAAAAEGRLVTFGIVPTYPATGYGYIRTSAGEGVRPVEVFVEKPDAATAAGFVADGRHLWNSGMFMFRASRYLEELSAREPAVIAAVAAAVEGARTPEPGCHVLDADAFARSPSISIDYAVMERTDDAVVVPLDAGWSDVGSWDAMYEVGPKDEAGNVLIGDISAHGMTRSYLRSEGPLLAAIGLESVVVVATDDAVLVTDVARCEDVKPLVEELRATARRQADHSTTRTKQWGRQTELARTDATTVVRIDITPGHTAPLGAGTWVIVEGTGESGTQTLGPGDSVRVEAAANLTNTHTANLVVIGVGVV